MALSVMVRATAPIPLDATFRAEPGELLALVGHSGAGKTTLLRTIAGLWRPETARVAVDDDVWLDTRAGVNRPAHRRHVGVVFQNYALFPHMTAAENVSAAMPRGAPNARAEAERLLDLVNMPGLADRKPAQLSGGQQQRVALARALARRPRALLLDEPFSAVDRATREGLYAEILSLREHLKMPVVVVTHDVDEAQLLADRMVVIDGGRVVSEGTTAEVMGDPEALRAMGVAESASILRATIAEHTDDGLTRLRTTTGSLFLPAIEGDPGTRVSVRIMAEDVILARERPEGLSAQNILAGRVSRIVPGAGSEVTVHVDVDDGEILARITHRAAHRLRLEPDDAVHAILKAVRLSRDRVRLAHRSAPR